MVKLPSPICLCTSHSKVPNWELKRLQLLKVRDRRMSNNSGESTGKGRNEKGTAETNLDNFAL